MKVEVKEINETRKQLLVEVSGDEVAREEKNVLGEFTRHADIKGVRKGKAPEPKEEIKSDPARNEMFL